TVTPLNRNETCLLPGRRSQNRGRSMAHRCFSVRGRSAGCALLALLLPLGCTSSLSPSQARGRAHSASPATDDPMDASPEPELDAVVVDMPEAAAKPDVMSMMMSDAGMPRDAMVKFEPCRPLDSMEPVMARSVVSSADARPVDRAIFTVDLFNQFKSNCGGCHVDTNLGNFQVRAPTAFPTVAMRKKQVIHERLHSDDAAFYMPVAGAPNAKPWSQRTPNDPVYELANSLELWFAAGLPQDLFYVKNESGGTGVSPYVM